MPLPIPIFVYIHGVYIDWPLWTPPFLLVAFTALSIVIAALSYKMVELPVTALGGRLARQWDPRSRPAHSETW